MLPVVLTLHPLPDTNFIHGYPGIPPVPGRPLAAVKGTIHLKANSYEVDATRLSVELRKIESLPEEGMSDTFCDPVVPGPVIIWDFSDNPKRLKTGDFTFSIRIPESVPPSITLGGQAGIRYELVANLCTRGRWRFLRRRTSMVISTQVPIVIDKHEMHPTWPVYGQQETRQCVKDGCILMVDRHRTCYGPGDRICVVATLKSNGLEDVLLQEFELTLEESTTFHTRGYIKKDSSPEVKVTTICNSRLSINGPLYMDAQHKAELLCSIPADHSTTSINSARHIDITYTLIVRALLNGRPPIVLALPVILSNWPRDTSLRAVRKIGLIPSLSLTHVNKISVPSLQTVSATSSLPSLQNSDFTVTTLKTDDSLSHTKLENTYGPLVSLNTDANHPLLRIEEIEDVVYFPPSPSLLSTQASSLGNRLDVLRFSRVPSLVYTPSREDTSPIIHPHKALASTSGLSNNNRPPEAENNRGQQLSEAIRTQKAKSVIRAPMPEIRRDTTAQPRAGLWLSSEEEKVRLFNKARAAAIMTQGLVKPPPYESGMNRAFNPLYLSPTNVTSLGRPSAVVYSSPMSAQKESESSLVSKQIRYDPVQHVPSKDISRNSDLFPQNFSLQTLPKPEGLHPKYKPRNIKPPTDGVRTSAYRPDLPQSHTALANGFSSRTKRPLPTPPTPARNVLLASEEKALLAALSNAKKTTSGIYPNEHDTQRFKDPYSPMDGAGNDSESNWDEDAVTLRGLDEYANEGSNITRSRSRSMP